MQRCKASCKSLCVTNKTEQVKLCAGRPCCDALGQGATQRCRATTQCPTL